MRHVHGSAPVMLRIVAQASKQRPGDDAPHQRGEQRGGRGTARPEAITSSMMAATLSLDLARAQHRRHGVRPV